MGSRNAIIDVKHALCSLSAIAELLVTVEFTCWQIGEENHHDWIKTQACLMRVVDGLLTYFLMTMMPGYFI